MKTNLKKAISAVSALALAGSVVPASFADKLTLKDVADTASYATAVNTLVALKVINGYEDGTFLPDNLITRAEATKVMVAALNQIDSAESMKGSTKFTDVEAKHEWATGFINAGVQAGYINGMGDGTFAPDANVTYAQMVKMLVSAMGYNEYAEFLGGYPNGFISIANSEGVTSGVKANADDNVTRAQVAQLVYNALTAPVVENKGVTYTDSGAIRPKIEKMNGEDGNKYKSLLTTQFNAYYVEGYVTATSKSPSAGLKTDEVNFGIAKSEKYDNDDLGLEAFKAQKNLSDYADVVDDPARIVTVKVGDTDAADYEGTYASAIILVDEYDDKSFISFQASGKNKTFKFDTSLVDDDEYETKGFDKRSENYLYIFASDSASKSTKYNLQANSSKELAVKLYVNGSLIADANTADATMREYIQKYVIDATVGDVELVDTYKTDGYYDAIYVNSYLTAQVDSVDKTKIRFSNTIPAGVASVDLDTENNDDLVYNIYYNGEKIALNEVKVDDVLSISYNVKDANKDAKANFKDADHYDIYVSRNVQTGKYNGTSKSNETVNIGGTSYKFIEDYATEEAKLSMSDEYTVYLDYFNRIFKTEKNTSAAKYGIIDKFTYSDSEENYKIVMFTADGEKKIVYFDGKKGKTIIDGKTTDGSAAETAAKGRIYTGTTKNAVEDRVVKYKISSSTGRVTSLEFLTGVEATADYKASTGAIGSVKVNDATKVIDSINYCANGYDDYSDLSIASKGSLVNSTNYTAFGFDKNDGYHQLVLVTKGKAAYNENTRFAVVADSTGSTQSEVTHEDVVTIPAYWYNTAEGADNSKQVTLIGNNDVYDEGEASKLQTGDVIVFTLDSNNEIDKFTKIFSFAGGVPEQDELTKKAIVAGDAKTLPTLGGAIANPSTDASSNWSKTWDNSDKAGEDDPIQLVFGPIVDKNGDKGFTVAKITSGTYDYDGKSQSGLITNLSLGKGVAGGVYDIDMTSDTAVYEYNYANSKKNRLALGSTSSIVKTSFSDSCLADDKDIIPWDLDLDGEKVNRASVNFAFAKVVDGVATDVIVFLAK